MRLYTAPKTNRAVLISLLWLPKSKAKGTRLSVIEDFTFPLLISAPVTIPIGATLVPTITTADIKSIVPSGIFNIQSVCKEKQFVF
jgi:hypothetical protein